MWTGPAAKGLKDTTAAEKTLLTENQARQAIAEHSEALMAKKRRRCKALGEEQGGREKFLAENGKKKGVNGPSRADSSTRRSTPGKGKSPKISDNVTTHYKGTLSTYGFDSSYKRGQPATFPVSGVIAGWTEALQLMKEGGKWQLFVPSRLVYGEKGAGQVIGPNATLIFEVELISVK